MYFKEVLAGKRDSKIIKNLKKEERKLFKRLMKRRKKLKLKKKGKK